MNILILIIQRIEDVFVSHQKLMQISTLFTVMHIQLSNNTTLQ